MKRAMEQRSRSDFLNRSRCPSCWKDESNHKRNCREQKWRVFVNLVTYVGLHFLLCCVQPAIILCLDSFFVLSHILSVHQMELNQTLPSVQK